MSMMPMMSDEMENLSPTTTDTDDTTNTDDTNEPHQTAVWRLVQDLVAAVGGELRCGPHGLKLRGDIPSTTLHVLRTHRETLRALALGQPVETNTRCKKYKKCKKSCPRCATIDEEAHAALSWLRPHLPERLARLPDDALLLLVRSALAATARLALTRGLIIPTEEVRRNGGEAAAEPLLRLAQGVPPPATSVSAPQRPDHTAGTGTGTGTG